MNQNIHRPCHVSSRCVLLAFVHGRARLRAPLHHSRTSASQVGQKRLTNICVVRLKRNGKRFEVACYKNTVIAWRNKVEKDVDEVLQAHTIYMNVEKGILAKSEDLTQAFGTDDEDVICLEILNKGEFQVSERERQMQMDSLFKDIASRVTDMCINPETQKPYPLSTIERALRECVPPIATSFPACMCAADALAAPDIITPAHPRPPPPIPAHPRSPLAGSCTLRRRQTNL